MTIARSLPSAGTGESASVDIPEKTNGAGIYGLDANLSYRFPDVPLNLRLGFEWLHARYTDLPNASNTTIVNGINTSVIADWSGRRLVRAPVSLV